MLKIHRCLYSFLCQTVLTINTEWNAIICQLFMTSILIYKYCCSQEKCYCICRLQLMKTRLLYLSFSFEATCGKVYFLSENQFLLIHNNILVSGIQDLKIITDNVAMLNVKNQKIMIFGGIWTDMSRNINNFIVIYWIMTIKKLINVLDLMQWIEVLKSVWLLIKFAQIIYFFHSSIRLSNNKSK